MTAVQTNVTSKKVVIGYLAVGVEHSVGEQVRLRHVKGFHGKLGKQASGGLDRISIALRQLKTEEALLKTRGSCTQTRSMAQFQRRWRLRWPAWNPRPQLVVLLMRVHAGLRLVQTLVISR